MKAFTRLYGFYPFWLLTILDLYAIYSGNESIHFFSKPLLVPSLLIPVLVLASAGLRKGFISGALAFSFGGDVLLMLEGRNPLFFILGLVCFLIAHLIYISYFLSQSSPGISLLKKQPWLLITVALYVAGLLRILYPGLGELKIPVMAYAIILSLMMLAAFHVYYKVPLLSAKLYIAGAIFFVLSDSLLAINKFYAVFPDAGIWIMLTYCLAQFLIIKGYILQDESSYKNQEILAKLD